jgi:hypothetical protein
MCKYVYFILNEVTGSFRLDVNSCIGSPNSQLPIRPRILQSPHYPLRLERDCLMPAYLLSKLRNSALLCNCVEFLFRNLPCLVVSQSRVFDSSYQTARTCLDQQVARISQPSHTSGLASVYIPGLYGMFCILWIT